MATWWREQTIHRQITIAIVKNECWNVSHSHWQKRKKKTTVFNHFIKRLNLIYLDRCGKINKYENAFVAIITWGSFILWITQMTCENRWVFQRNHLSEMFAWINAQEWTSASVCHCYHNACDRWIFVGWKWQLPNAMPQLNR